jgi:hypothetical protein
VGFEFLRYYINTYEDNIKMNMEEIGCGGELDSSG